MNTWPTRRLTHRGPYKNGPGEIYYPIAIDGTVIESGDLIVGDDDGLVCVPRRDADAIYVAAAKKAEAERKNDSVTDGRKWIDESLIRLGCEFSE